MAIYIRVSPKTREARRYLESIKSPDGKPKGKVLLKNFLNTELSNKLSSKSSPQSIIKYIETSNDSNITEFAKLLLGNEGNQKNFKSAVKSQAHSTGTKKDGLFNKLIYREGNLKFEDLSKSKIKAFLLAKQDSDINKDEDKDINGNHEDVIAEEDKKSRRMKNKDIVEKINSGRLSNVLKAFMALVLWDYLKLKEKQPKELVEEQKRKEQEEIERIKRIEKMAVEIREICSFNTDGICLTQYETYKIREFRRDFNKYNKKDSLKKYLMSLLSTKNGTKKYVKHKDDVEELYPMISTPKTSDLPKDAQQITKLSEEDLVRDLRYTYEEDYYEGEDYEEKNLTDRTKGFREIVNSVKRQDEDIDLKFENSFFDQKFEAPYRNIKASEMTEKWGVNIDDVLKLNKDGGYDQNVTLQKKIKKFLNKWFPECKAEMERSEKEKIYVPITDYILGENDDDSGRFGDIMTEKKDTFTPKLFLKVLYSFEKETERLGMKYEDFTSGKNSEDPKKERLKEFWNKASVAFDSLSNGCSVQFQGTVNLIALYYDEYQTDIEEMQKDNSADNGISFSDRKFCQLLRDQATNRTVASCKTSSNRSSGVDFARLLRSVFTPLVNASNSGYHSEPCIGDLGETYESLAVKWKNKISSIDLIKEVLNKVIPSTDSFGIRDKLKDNYVNYDKFISVVKVFNKKSKKDCKNEMEKIYKLMMKKVKEGGDQVSDETLESLEEMRKWMKNEKSKFTIREFYCLTTGDFYEIVDEFKKIDIFNTILKSSEIDIILYILHLDDVGLMKISE